MVYNEERERQTEQFAKLCESGDFDGVKLMVEKIPNVPVWLGIRSASSWGHIHILEWWRQMVIEKRITNEHFELIFDNILDGASSCGNIDVLNWWHLNSIKVIEDGTGFELKFSASVLFSASMYGRANVLNWWYEKQHIYPIDYDKASRSCIKTAIYDGQINVLDWWFKKGFKIEYSNETLLGAAKWKDEHIQIDVLDWLLKKSLVINQFKEIAEKAIGRAMVWGRTDVLEWWRLKIITQDDFNYPCDKYLYVISYAHTAPLEWLMKHDKKASVNIINALKENIGLIPIKCIEWLTKNGFMKIPISEKILELYNENEYNQIINFYL